MIPEENKVEAPFVLQAHQNAEVNGDAAVSKCPAHTSAARSKRGWRQSAIETNK